jgi:hypothetical protein
MRGEKQGITPEQMAQTGSISFMDAIALKQMADRARASAPPDQAQQAQPSVVDELRMQAMQAGREALPSGGLPSLPAPNIGSAAMASGGIVAFSKGDLVGKSEGANEAEIRRILSLPPIRRSVNEVETLARAGYSVDADRFREDPSKFNSEWAPNQFSSGIDGKFPNGMVGDPKSPHDFRPVSAFGTPSLGSTRNDPKLLNSISPAIPEVASAAPAPEQAAPEQDPNADIYKEIEKLLGSGRAQGISAPRLNASSLFPDTRVSQAEQDKIRGDLRAEGEASGLPGLLRRGAERTGKDIEDVKKNKRSDTWLLLAQAGFGIAGSADPFGVAVGKAGQQFAGQYATLNKDLKKEIRELNKDQESYQKSMAEFELNQNSESRRRVDEAQRRIDSRQDKVAEMAMKQADLDFRAGIANQSEETQRRGMRLQALLAKIKNPEKVTLQSEFVEAARRGETAKMDALIVAAQRWAEASPQVIAARINNQNNPDAVVGANLNSDGFSELLNP